MLCTRRGLGNILELWYFQLLSTRIRGLNSTFDCVTWAACLWYTETSDLSDNEVRDEEVAAHTAHMFNPLNAELNPIYHLLILLGDLTFMGPCIVSIFYYIFNKMQRYTVYLYLETV
jgi:hypothetical protein